MNILILHASAGAGHRRAAEALARTFNAHPLQPTTTVADILDFTPALFRETYAKGYLRIVRVAPELWGYMYAHSDRKSSVPWRRKVRSAFQAINTAALRGFLDKCRPDLIVCTHFMPLELLSSPSRRRRWPVPRYCVVTDFAVHSLWIVANVQGFFVATEYARQHLIRMGIAAERIHVTGIPVDPAFAAAAPAAAVRTRLGLDPGRPTVLVMSGGFGVGPSQDFLRAFLGPDPGLQMLVVAGASKSLRQDCERVAAELRFPVKVYGFVDNIAELMDAADLVVSKPGGLTASEVLAKGKPMVIVNPIPGQEQRNCEYLLEEGAATRVYAMNGAPFRILKLLGDPARLARIAENARRIGHPDAARVVAETILDRRQHEL